MKVKNKIKIGEHLVISHISDAVADPAATMAKILPLTTPAMTDQEKELLYNENLVYGLLGNEAEYIVDELGEQLQNKLDAKGEHQLLLDDGEYITDNRNVEYWIKKSSKWKKEKIGEEAIGVELPPNAILQENLSKEQLEEISAQQEAERVASLTPEQRAKERIALLKRELADTDYVAAKIAEGSATIAEYADAIAQRQAWRQEINTLEEVA